MFQHVGPAHSGKQSCCEAIRSFSCIKSFSCKAMRRLVPRTSLVRQLVSCEAAPGASWDTTACASTSAWHSLQPSSDQQQYHHQHHGSFANVRHMSMFSKLWGGTGPTSTQDSGSSQFPTPSGMDGSQSDALVQQGFWPLPEASDEAYRAIFQAMNAGDYAVIAAAKADAFFSSSWIMSAVQSLHDSQGLPWWAAIAACNVMCKIGTFPLALLAQKASAQTVDTQSKMTHISELQRLAQVATTRAEAMKYQTAARQAYESYQATHGSPFKHMFKLPPLMIAQAAVFLSVFNGVRNLMNSQAYSLMDGGMLWFPDLTVSDPYYGLPVLCALSTVGMVAKGMNLDETAMTGGQAGFRKMLKYFLYGAGLMFIPAGSMVPAGVAVLWVSNSCVSILQGSLLRTARFRQLVGLPSLEAMKAVKERTAQVQAVTSSPPATSPASYDAEKAAVELAAKAQKDGAGRPVLFTHNPAAGRGGARRSASRP